MTSIDEVRNNPAMLTVLQRMQGQSGRPPSSAQDLDVVVESLIEPLFQRQGVGLDELIAALLRLKNKRTRNT